MNNTTTLTQLNSSIESCRKCDFDNNNDVRYCGGHGTDSRAMFIAESPSSSGGTGIKSASDNFGSTPADKLFFDIKKEFGLENCYTTDLVKCGKKNSKPTLTKILNCRDYLQEEISIINPKVLVAVGKTIAFVNDGEKTSMPFKAFLEIFLNSTLPIIWTYHYSYIYRYKRNDRSMIEKYKNQHNNIKKSLKTNK